MCMEDTIILRETRVVSVRKNVLSVTAELLLPYNKLRKAFIIGLSNSTNILLCYGSIYDANFEMIYTSAQHPVRFSDIDFGAFVHGPIWVRTASNASMTINEIIYKE